MVKVKDKDKHIILVRNWDRDWQMAMGKDRDRLG